MFHTWSSQCQPQSNQPGYFAWWRGSSQEGFRSQIERSADMPPIKQPRSSPKGVGLDFMSCQDDAEFHIVPLRISWHLPKDRRFISWHHWTFEDVETTDLSMFVFDSLRVASMSMSRQTRFGEISMHSLGPRWSPKPRCWLMLYWCWLYWGYTIQNSTC